MDLAGAREGVDVAGRPTTREIVIVAVVLLLLLLFSG